MVFFVVVNLKVSAKIVFYNNEIVFVLYSV